MPHWGRESQRTPIKRSEERLMRHSHQLLCVQAVASNTKYRSSRGSSGETDVALADGTAAVYSGLHHACRCQ
jgi:hypothetical protein